MTTDHQTEPGAVVTRLRTVVGLPYSHPVGRLLREAADVIDALRVDLAAANAQYARMTDYQDALLLGDSVLRKLAKAEWFLHGVDLSDDERRYLATLPTHAAEERMLAVRAPTVEALVAETERIMLEGNP